jgi:hypothetical protein
MVQTWWLSSWKPVENMLQPSVYCLVISIHFSVLLLCAKNSHNLEAEAVLFCCAVIHLASIRSLIVHVYFIFANAA